MTLAFGGGLFPQRDVRETPASTATATAVGLTDGKYVVIDFHADMTDERKLAVNTSDLSLTDAGANSTVTIALANKTSYLSIAAHAFLPRAPNSDTFQYSVTNGILTVTGGAVSDEYGASVNLPHGSIVTDVILWGNISDETWFLRREEVASGAAGETMATAVFNTEDSSISNATINNSTHRYWLATSGIDNTDQIYGARITYTTDYI